MSGKRQHFSDDEKAEALLALEANGGNVAATSRELGISEKTLACWAKGRGVHAPSLQKQDENRPALSDRLEDLAHRLVGALTDKIDGANAREVATALGITIDKMQILRGKPSEITHDTSAIESVQRKLARLSESRDQAGIPQ